MAISRFTLVEILTATNNKPAIQVWTPGAYEQPGLSSAHKILGVTMTACDNDQQVAVMKCGYLRDVVRQNGEEWSIGDILWAKSDGSITKTRPTAPLPLVLVGTVFETTFADNESAQHTVDVNVRVLPSMGELSGVLAETPVDTDIFVYDEAINCWVPRIMFAHTPGPTGQPNDGEVLYWDTTNKQALGSADLVFNDVTKSLDVTGREGITADATGTIPLTITGFSGQTANLQEWRSSVPAVLAYVEKGGAIKSLGSLNATVAKTGAYTATINDHLIKCNASGGAFTITLPAAASFAGMLLHIKKTDSSANAITIDGNASELVEDDVTQQLLYQGENFMLQCDGTQWWVI